MSESAGPVVLADKTAATAADLERLEAENARMAAQLASLRTRGNPATLLALEWGERVHGFRCGGRTAGVMHDVVMLNEDSRTVRCRSCGEVLDAFGVLLDFARGERQFNFNLDAGRREIERLRSEIPELTRVRKNLMAAVARAKKMIRDGEAVAAAAIQAAARAEADAVEAAAAARAAEEERLRNGPLPIDPYDDPKNLPR